MKYSPKGYRELKEKRRKQALDSIRGIFLKADEAFRASPKIADRLVRRARKLAMKHKIRLPRVYKRRFCKNCYCFLVPSVNCRVRLSGQKVIYFCFGCRKYMRFPYVREKRQRMLQRLENPKTL
ncbi:ribonuclease P [Candidatus Woesearchaeota archaeon]|nr:ribonuclease P [Candidatus Woesearchaeota archaeon]